MAYKILVVDDEAHYADMLRDLLLQHNFITDMAVSVPQALEALQSEDYALIIADYKMPGMDGSEFLQRVRVRNSTIPFFMVSGLMNTHELIRVANLGATLVFEKPLEVPSFIESVKKYIAPLSDADFQKRFRGDVSGENYPDELIHLSDRSHLGKHFVRKLWLAFQRERLAVVRLRPGAELELIAKEISQWKGRANAQFYTLTPEDFAHADCAEALNAIVTDPDVSPVVILHKLETATPEQAGVLAEFLKNGSDKIHAELFFLIVVENDARAARIETDHPALAAALQSGIIELPPLRERPGDIAKYARRILSNLAKISGDMSKAWLGPDAVGLLLQHPWRGEYDELSIKLDQIVSLDRPSPLRAEDFAAILPGEENTPAGSYSLKRRLLLAQSEAIETMLAKTGGDLRLSLARMGVPEGACDNHTAETPLYPGLFR